MARPAEFAGLKFGISKTILQCSIELELFESTPMFIKVPGTFKVAQRKSDCFA